MTESKPTPRLLLPGTGGSIPRVSEHGRGRFDGDQGKFDLGYFEIVVFMEHQNGEICEVVEEDIKMNVVRQEVIVKNHKG